MPAPPLRLATRGSPLARWQAQHVAALLRAIEPGLSVELEIVETTGDRRQDRPVWEMGGQGVFVKEVQAAVLDGRADAAVHSAKDLPSSVPSGLALVAAPARADPRDVLVGNKLAGLAPGAVVATGAVRRRAQLAWLRPDLTFASLRGNIATRLGRVPPGGAVVMAAAALDRLGLQPEVVDYLDMSVMLPQVGQGVIAVEAPEASPWLDLLRSVDDPATSRCLLTERAFLARLGGGCDLPVGAHARVGAGSDLEVEGLMASGDGRVVLRRSLSGRDPQVGSDLAERLLEAGGRELLSL